MVLTVLSLGTQILMDDREDLRRSLVVQSHRVEKAEQEVQVLLPDAKEEQEKVETYLAEPFTLRDVRRVLGLREDGCLSAGLVVVIVANWRVSVVS